MTQAFLQSELMSLISDSKRKYSDVRSAAEQSLSDLRAISVTSESQLAADLLRRADFINPFILACKTKNIKLVSSGTVCLQRLTASKAIARSRLRDLLDAFGDGVNSGYEPQLKILQTLPSLLQLYASDIYGPLLARILQICVALQASKTAIVSNTAAATFQQLINSVFERGAQPHSSRAPSDSESPNSEDPSDKESDGSDDAIRVFDDLCLLLNHQVPNFVKLDGVSPEFLLETLHTILSNHSSFLVSQLELVQACRENLLPGLSRQIARKDGFGTSVRAIAILLLLVQASADILQEQLQPIIASLISSLEKDGNILWKRALYLEFFREIFADFSTLRKLFELFDSTGKSSVIGLLLSSFVRVAAEDPSLIGLGRQSTIPVYRGNDLRGDEVASIEAQGLGGAITSVSSADLTTIGLSTEWSVVTTPLLKQPEKHVAPAIPSTYVYTLVLECTASFCDGLSRFVMPLSVPTRSSRRDSGEDSRGNNLATDARDDGPARKPSRSSTSSQKYQRLVNPLQLSKNTSLAQIQLCAAMVEACWPAALAICSTFLNSALDSEFYHILIRSVQKLAQVSGVLELSTPRDALLTTLAKASIPANASSVIAAYQGSKTAKSTDIEELDDPTESLHPPREPPPTPTHQASSSPLNVRHLLCLRALLNLGIALGPTLEKGAWFILIETMQHVEALIAIPTTLSTASQGGTPKIGTTGHESQTTLASEIAAVQAATKRMLESTRGYNAAPFANLVNALFRLLGQDKPEGGAQAGQVIISSPTSSTKLEASRPTHHASRSVSGLWTKSKTLDMEISFVLSKISEISRINLYRFTLSQEHDYSWDLITSRLLKLCQNHSVSDGHRIQSASVVDLIAMETVKLLDDANHSVKDQDVVRIWCLEALMKQLQVLTSSDLDHQDDVQYEIHKRLLDALESMLSHSGDALRDSWPIALDILSLSFAKLANDAGSLSNLSTDMIELKEKNAQILRVGFRSIQLITSDFLSVLTVESLAKLAQLLRDFGSQNFDVNVALTSTTLLWSLASQTLTRLETIGSAQLPISPTVLEDIESLEGAAGTELLWSITVAELLKLCGDERGDIRNAATRILLKTLEASSESLTANAWATVLVSGPFSIIRFALDQGKNKDHDQGDWMSSVAQLTEGIVLIITQNLNVIAKHQTFANTWDCLMDVFEAVLNTKSLSAASLAFANINSLLSTIPLLGKFDDALLTPVLRIWSTYHPADIQDSKEQVPNQFAFSAHARTFVQAYKTCPSAVQKYEHNGAQVEAILGKAIERTILLSSHPPYTSDVKTPSIEQTEVLECLSILRTLLPGAMDIYCQHLLHLERSMLMIANGRVNATKKSAIMKSVQRPTFIAFASACLDILRSMVLEFTQGGGFIHHQLVEASFNILSALIRTKYTDLPSNNDAPLWRNATITAVVMLEAITKENSKAGKMPDEALVSGMADSLIPLTSNILSPGGLSNPPTKQKPEILLEDESFDISQFQRLHKCVVSLFQHECVENSACTKYAIVIFNASLIAKPWFYDLPADLDRDPLKGLTDLRAGTVHKPVFAVRRRICCAALDALFGLVAKQANQQDGNDGGKPRARSRFSPSHSLSHRLARNAAPYLLLRVVHPLKTLLSDQRLRGLTPPPPLQQGELQTVLTRFVELRSDGRAFAGVAASQHSDGGTALVSGGQDHHYDDYDDENDDDGKEHLRILYSFLLRVSQFWRALPRLKGEGAWQADEAGRAIDDALSRWSEAVGEGWGV
ncbi:uncharacterized protein A1O9_11229 [Exophiala aquamarina CBS 119918]|uniref:Protein MON2 homolog n=1 Tax=Exophiala aquamarina CBS 119918 TaxID=1182545 RepID=A0A072NZH6_9EURO|nr:uncharacterized protein A1O9_11229 [Exophiala aquamarina CBS 119918]KEF52812.1 hypothetical protein A1O9_11229 [Exophiala aquamarina CBS 119918]